MGLTKRSGGWYVEFPVIDSEDGNTLVLATGVAGSRLKRWKVGGSNKTAAKDYETAIKTQLIQGKIASKQGVASVLTFSVLADRYLALPTIKTQTTYREKAAVLQDRFIPLFGDRTLTAITSA